METIELILSSGLLVLIWIIQCLHYPSFLFIDQSKFSQFEVFHTKRISYIVMPLMLGEAFLLFIRPDPILFALVSLIWLSTFLLQVPCHQKLSHGYDEVVIKKLIRTNWIRTILWSLKMIYLVGWRKW